MVGLLYAYLPLMILPLYASIERLGRSPREAAADLGAGPVAGFFRITFPMTLPGVMAGCIFVFVPSLGNFIVPDLLGGGKSIMVGNLIQSQFFQARDWPFGATLALCVIAITMVLLVDPGVDPRPGAEAGGPWRVRPGGRATASWAPGSILVYAFLYAPILVLIVLSFNGSGSTSTWGGFSTQWYRELLDSQELIDALKNTRLRRHRRDGDLGRCSGPCWRSGSSAP